jgi:hypothetical protein
MIQFLTQKFCEVLSAPSGAVLPAGKIGMRIPDSRSELPFIALSFLLQSQKCDGIHKAWGLTAKSFPEEARGETYNGELRLEIWSETIEQAEKIFNALDEKIAKDRAGFRRNGFINLYPSLIEAIVAARCDSSSGTPFFAFKQRYALRFAFEAELIPEESGGVITKINVEIDDRLHENIIIPS